MQNKEPCIPIKSESVFPQYPLMISAHIKVCFRAVVLSLGYASGSLKEIRKNIDAQRFPWPHLIGLMHGMICWERLKAKEKKGGRRLDGRLASSAQ